MADGHHPRKRRFRNSQSGYGRQMKKQQTNKRKSFIDVGAIYAPYIPLYITPTFLEKPVPNSPLEDFVEGVFQEEIESGELKPVRPDKNEFVVPEKFRNKRVINPKFYEKATISNL